MSGASTHVDDTAQRTNSIGTIDWLGATSRILHDCASHHNYVLGGVRELLDGEVDHLAKASIFVLE